MIYLDNSATTMPFEAVLDAMRSAEHFNPSSLYAPAMRGEAMLTRMREALLLSLGLDSSEWRVTLTGGGTEADNLAVIGAALALRGRKKHFIGTEIEHPAVRMSLKAVEAMGHDVTLIKPDGTGVICPEALAAAMRDDTAFISIMHVNNETGARQPIEELARLAKERLPRALFHCDGVQGFLRDKIDLTYVDLYSVSAHKVHGPKGVGALMRREKAGLLPLLHGGGQEDGLRSGTENTVGALGFAMAVEWFTKNDTAANLRAMKLALWRGITRELPDTPVNGPAPDSCEAAPHIINMSYPIPGEVLLHALEGEGVLVSTRSACSSRRRDKAGPLRAMGLEAKRENGAIRFSLSPLNTMKEIEQAVEIVGRIVRQYMKYTRA